MKKTVVLIVLDGYGIGSDHPSNAIWQANPKSIKYITENFPSGAIQASGIAVGLPWGEEGNSEVGHLTMGIGRTIYQHYPRISLDIRNGNFFKNKTILNSIDQAIENKKKINFVGLIGQANVHSSMEHLNALIKLAEKKKVNYALHLFTDGRDSEPESANKVLLKLPKEKIGSLSGRYYAMDRDKHWTLTQSAYGAMVGDAKTITTEEIQQHLKETYNKNLNDEYIIPVSIDPEKNAIHEGDSIFFFNFREDRMRQLSSAFILKGFDKFATKNFSDLKISSMTAIKKDFGVPIAFPPQIIKASLGKILADNKKTQLRIAETQKYAHVTFFFNGLVDKPFKNEYRILIPSLNVTHLEKYPQMRTEEITTRAVEAIGGRGFDFILMNYAAPDMLAHTGNLKSTIEAIKIVDTQLKRILQAIFQSNSYLIITADHGNAERLYNPKTGEIETKHDSSPVPIYLVGKDFYRKRSKAKVKSRKQYTIGMLSDIAPTVLDLMDLQKPEEMDGQSLLPQLLS